MKKTSKKRLMTSGLSLLLAGLMIGHPVIVLPQSSQNIPQQEDIAEALDIINSLIDALESLESQNGNYTLEVGEDFQQAGLFHLFGFMYLMRNRPNEADLVRQRRLETEIKQLESQTRGMEQSRLEQRQELESEQRYLRGQQMDNYVQREDRFRFEQDQNRQGQIWEYRDESYRFRSERNAEFRGLGIGRRTQGKIYHSTKLEALKKELGVLARKHGLVIQPEFRFSVKETSRYGREIYLDPRTVINIQDPRQPSLTIESKSLKQIMDGESFSLSDIWRRDGTEVTQQLKKSLSDISMSSDNKLLTVNVRPFLRKWGRRALLLGVLGGGFYYFFLSDNDSEGQGSLSDMSYRIDLPQEEFEGILNNLYEQKEALMGLQPSTVNEGSLLDL